ncbi:hypothetical protein KC963_01400 [Candidatus Saccharibacteria bacterium]|nr:hypothetical protein [Candidatus Saccharibacteria bacterium]
MNAIEHIQALADCYDRGELTWQEFARWKQAIIADCPHDRVIHADDEDGVLSTWCVDCEEEL